MFVRLGAPEATVAERIGEVVASIARGKDEMKAMSKDAAMLYAIAALGLAELLDATRLKQLTRPLANFVLSNVPGARETLYLDGARLLGSFPISALGMGVGLNVTLASYADTMDFGFVANGRALKDLPQLARHTREAYEALKAAAPAGRKARPRRQRTTAARTPPPAPEGQPRGTVPGSGRRDHARRADGRAGVPGRRWRPARPSAPRRAVAGRRDFARRRATGSGGATERTSGADALMLCLDRAKTCPARSRSGSSIRVRTPRALHGRVSSRPGLRASGRCRGCGSATCRCRWAATTPVRVDDPAFDLDGRRRRLGCLAAGTQADSGQLTAERCLHPLEPTRPPWPMGGVAGMAGGGSPLCFWSTTR